jgi:DNA-directed RNA polymerase subunit K/omega
MSASPSILLIKHYLKNLLTALEEAAKKKAETEKVPEELNKKEE